MHVDKKVYCITGHELVGTLKDCVPGDVVLVSGGVHDVEPFIIPPGVSVAGKDGPVLRFSRVLPGVHCCVLMRDKSHLRGVYIVCPQTSHWRERPLWSSTGKGIVGDGDCMTEHIMVSFWAVPEPEPKPNRTKSAAPRRRENCTVSNRDL